MARSRFVHPQTIPLTLANGDTVIVKRRLNIGEQRESYTACSTLVEQPDGSVKTIPNPLLIGMAKVAAYVIDWHLAGDDEPLAGLDLMQRIAVLNNLDPDDFYELKAVIDVHEAAMIAERVAEKNGQSGEINTPRISPLPSDAAGVSIGSGS